MYVRIIEHKKAESTLPWTAREARAARQRAGRSRAGSYTGMTGCALHPINAGRRTKANAGTYALVRALMEETRMGCALPLRSIPQRMQAGRGKLCLWGRH